MSAECCINCKVNSVKDVMSNKSNDCTLFPVYHSELQNVFTYVETWTGYGPTLYLCTLCRTLFQTFQASKEKFFNLTKPKTKIALLQNQNKCHRLFECDQSGANILNTDVRPTSTNHEEDEFVQGIETILPDNEINNEELPPELRSSTDSSLNDIKVIEFQEKFLKLQIKKLPKKFNSNFHNNPYIKKEVKSICCKTIEEILECTKCGRKFQEVQLLQNHITAAHFDSFERNFSCTFCPQSFSTQWFFKNHIISRHAGIEILHSCQVCLKNFHNEKHLNDHMLKAHDMREHAYKCRHCVESFTKIDCLRSHLLEHHKGTKEAESAESNLKLLAETMRKCNYCPATYNSFTQLRYHIKVAHDKPNYECTVCKGLFNSQQEMVSHRNTHQYCVLCEETFENFERLKGHIENVHEINENRPYCCEMCGQCHKSNSRLLAHYCWHIHINDVPKHFCNICNKSFTLRHQLNQHIKTHFNSSTQYKCDHCEKGFKVKYKLNCHMENVHEAVCAFSCKTCGKRFLTQKSLNAHSRIHTIATNFKPGYCSRFKTANLIDPNTQRPVDKIEVTSCFSAETLLFKCPVCGKTCDIQTHFIRHLRIVHNITGFRDLNITMNSSVKCPQCDKSFSRKDQLNKHRRRQHMDRSSAYVRNEFECPYCLKTLKNYGFDNFKKHIKRHETFIISSNKERKVKSKMQLCEFYNEKDKRYLCIDCDVKMSKMSDFLKHLKLQIHVQEYKVEYLDKKESKTNFPFRCPLCPDKSFPNKALLTKHNEIHSSRRNRNK